MTDGAVVDGVAKRKPSRRRKNPAMGSVNKAAAKEKQCFVCFESSGELFACGRRNCSKVYHTACIGRDEAYFQKKGKWSCGWHICTSCRKTAHYMCYTCPYSLCRECNEKAAFICVRGNKGFCEACITTVRLIESKEHINDRMVCSPNLAIEVHFDDKKSFDYLFKMYWFDLKGKLALSSEEFTRVASQRKESLTRTEENSDESYDVIDDHESSSDSLSGYCEQSTLSRNGSRSVPVDSSWASEELLEFVTYMRDGDKSILSCYDLQDLLLEYVQQKRLRDPHKKSQILCDQRLQKLFGTVCVGHFEILRLLESHLIKEVQRVAVDDKQEGYAHAAEVMSADKRQKMHKRVDEEPQTNFDYAAVDVHNISLIYLRRDLVIYLLEDISKFNEDVVGSFVRIRITSDEHEQDMYRLVQVIGTHEAAGQYEIGNKMTNINLEIVNLDKKEVVPIKIISNQEFTKDECERLKQSIRLGFVSRLTVGEFLKKAMVLHGVSVNYSLESEKIRVAHLRDRASEKGHKKELRLCVEKLQLLSNPEEQKRRLNKVIEVHSDPKMDPNYESPEEEEKPDDTRENNFVSMREISSLKMVRAVIPSEQEASVPSNDWNSAEKNLNPPWESNRSPQNQVAGSGTNRSSWHQGNGVFKTKSGEAPNTHETGAGLSSDQLERVSVQSYGVAFGNTSTSLSTDVLVTSKASESEPLWHYQDPIGRIQGPFTMEELHKWSTKGFFPSELRIWRKTEKQQESILLTDALSGKFEKHLSHIEPQDNSFPHLSNATTSLDAGLNKCAGACSGDNDATWVNKENADHWNASWNKTMLAKSDEILVPGETNLNDETAGMSSKGWKFSNNTNALSGQHESRIRSSPTAQYSEKPYKTQSFHFREDRGRDSGSWVKEHSHVNSWSSNRSLASHPDGQGHEKEHCAWNLANRRLPVSELGIPKKAETGDAAHVVFERDNLHDNSWTSSQKKTSGIFDHHLALESDPRDKFTLSNDVACSCKPCLIGQNMAETYCLVSHMQQLPSDGSNNFDPGNGLLDACHRSTEVNMALAGDGYRSNSWSGKGSISEMENISNPKFFQSDGQNNVASQVGLNDKLIFPSSSAIDPIAKATLPQSLSSRTSKISSCTKPLNEVLCQGPSTQKQDLGNSSCRHAPPSGFGLEQNQTCESCPDMKKLGDLQLPDKSRSKLSFPSVTASKHSGMDIGADDVRSWEDSEDTKSKKCSMSSPTPSGWDVCADSILDNRIDGNITEGSWVKKAQEHSNANSDKPSQWEGTQDKKRKERSVSSPFTATKHSGWDVGPGCTSGNSKEENSTKGDFGRKLQEKSNANDVWETLLECKSNTREGWGTWKQVKSNSNRGWEKSKDGERNRVGSWQTPAEKNVSALAGWETSAGWKTPEVGRINSSMGWGISLQESMTEVSPVWGTRAATNSNATVGWGSSSQKTMDASTGWKTPAPSNTNASAGWDTWAEIRTRTDSGALARQAHTQKCGWDVALKQTSNPKKRSSNEGTGWGTALEKNVTWDRDTWGLRSNRGGYRQSGQRERCLDFQDGGLRHDTWSPRPPWKRSSNEETRWGTAFEKNVNRDTDSWGSRSNRGGCKQSIPTERYIDGKDGEWRCNSRSPVSSRNQRRHRSHV